MKHTLKEIALHLLAKYHNAELTNIYEYSGRIDEDEKSLDSECNAIRKEIEDSDEIPVEWIKKYAKEHRAYIHEFKNMLAEWKGREE